MRLELQRLSAAYGDTTVLRDADLIVPDGRAVALLGPNGAGKTTLLSVVSGLLPPRWPKTSACSRRPGMKISRSSEP
jgi:ABC-type multidrug transport system ATPase subunit